MKKLNILALAAIVASPLALAESTEGTASAPAEKSGSSYITGNLQHNTERATQSTVEVGHTFSSNTTILAEVANKLENGVRSVSDTTLGIEQSFNITENFWVAAGYHNLSLDGSTSNETGQHRPLVKIGYDFDNGISLSNRTRAHYSLAGNAGEDHLKEIRYDTNIAYTFDNDIQIKANWIRNQRDFVDTAKHGLDSNKSSDNFEFRITQNNAFNSGIAPYFEIRDEDTGSATNGVSNKRNVGIVLGASYAF